MQEVDPPPGSSSFVPDAVTVQHSITSPDEDVRLVIDGVDVTTYAAFDAGLLSYVPDTGPVDLAPGEHFATVQRVTLPVDGADYGVLDSYTWKFNID